MIQEQISKHIKELLNDNKKENITVKSIARVIGVTQRRVQQKVKEGKWSIEDIQVIEDKFGEKILYSAKDFFAKEDIKAVLHIELKNNQKEKILKQLIGKEDLEILNK